MAMKQEATVLIGVFANRRRAEHFVSELKRAGFRDPQIGVVTPHGEGAATVVEDDTVAGALTGGTLGALAGVALAAGLVPGVGPVLVGGLLAGLFGGATVGAVAGGLVGLLIGLGVSEEEARRYERELKAGRTLVVVQGEGRFGDALAILRRVEKEGEAVPPDPPRAV